MKIKRNRFRRWINRKYRSNTDRKYKNKEQSLGTLSVDSKRSLDMYTNMVITQMCKRNITKKREKLWKRI